MDHEIKIPITHTCNHLKNRHPQWARDMYLTQGYNTCCWIAITAGNQCATMLPFDQADHLPDWSAALTKIPTIPKVKDKCFWHNI